MIVAGGVESISCVQNEMNTAHARRELAARAQARDLLADAADRGDGGQALRASRASGRTSTASQSQQRAAAARAAGRFKDEIVPITTIVAWPTRRPAHDHARR